MTVKTTIRIFLTATILLFAATGAEKDSHNGTERNTRESFGPQGFNDDDGYSPGHLNGCDKCGVRGGFQVGLSI